MLYILTKVFKCTFLIYTHTHTYFPKHILWFVICRKRMRLKVVFLRYHSICLKLRCLPTQKPGAHDLSLSKRLVRGKSDIFVSLYHVIPTTGGPPGCLQTVCTWLKHRQVLHRHLLNLQTSVLYSQTTWKDGSLGLMKMSNLSPSLTFCCDTS